MLREADARYQFVGNDGAVFYFTTDKDAPRGRFVAIDTSKRGVEWREIVPQAAETLEGVSYVGGRFLASYLKDAHTQVKVFDKEGKRLSEVAFPGLGTAAGFEGKPYDAETFYSFTSYTAPPTIYRLDVRTGETHPVFAPKLTFNPADYTTEQVFYPSRDGTKVPMFISYKRGLQKNGANPTVLYGYGGFSISLTPAFSPANLVWMEMGGIYAVPNLRGGGEYGEDWHLAGTKGRKQNVFDDFIGAAEYLIANKYTSTPKLAIYGGSNGGLLVGACLTQRPDLYGAALPAVGVMDMLRFQRFTIGWGWASDYGSSDNAEDFNWLYAYSPLHHIREGVHYPPTLITTSDHDDRVVPAHSFKFAATLQAAQGGEAPVLIRIETKSGHGGGRPTSKLIEEVADRWAFLDQVLGVSNAEPDRRAAEVGPLKGVAPHLLDVPIQRCRGSPERFTMTAHVPPARPDPNTYWLIEGRLLAGEYPGASNPVQARAKVAAFLNAGITAFIDLTEAHELAPYKSLLPGTDIEYHRFPIRDVSVPRDARYMNDILDAIDAALAAGRNVYVHCWGGIGRTGTVVACWLQRHGRGPDEALQELARLWQNMSKRHRQPRSPETDEQIAWVRNWPTMGNTKDGGR